MKQDDVNTHTTLTVAHHGNFNGSAPTHTNITPADVNMLKPEFSTNIRIKLNELSGDLK